MRQAVNSTGLILQSPNGIKGGDFSTNPWQRGTSFPNAFSSGPNTADRFYVSRDGTGDGTVAQRTVTVPDDFPVYSPTWLGVTVTTAEASIAAGSTYGLWYRMEGYDWANYYNSAFTISFYAMSNVVGQYTLAVRNSNDTYTYRKSFNITVADTVQYFSIPIPQMPSPAANNFTNGTGLAIRISLGAGSSFVSTDGIWEVSPIMASTGQTNLFSAVNNYFAINLVKMEQGNVATPYFPEETDAVLEQCNRYFRKTYAQGTAPGAITEVGKSSYDYEGGATASANYPLGVERFAPMRTTPTITFYSPLTGASGVISFSGGIGDFAANALFTSDNSFIASSTSSIAAGRILSYHYTASAEFF